MNGKIQIPYPRNRWMYPLSKLFLNFIFLFAFYNSLALAKGSAPVYEENFDIGSGGASLTRATQAGMIFSNPALIPYGAGFHRWAGNDTTLIAGKDSVDFIKSLQSKSSSSSSSSESQVQFVEKIMTTPVHAGAKNNLAYINRSFGLSVFNHAEVDLSAKKYGDTGLPSVRFRAESYHGVGMSFASLAISRALSVGVTGKYLYAGEPDLAIDLTDQTAIKNLQSSDGLQKLVAMNTGTGVDAGMLFFSQGLNNDFRLALKADDVGGTKLTGKGTLKEIKQTYSTGIGYTLHNGIDSIHVSADYRDIQGVYQEPIFKRFRSGAKYLIRNHLGIGAGYYDGWPSYALELDLWVFRLTGSYYTRELGTKPGMDSRPIYAVSFSMGM